MFLSARSALTLVSSSVSGYAAYWRVQLRCYSLHLLNMYACSCWNRRKRMKFELICMCRSSYMAQHKSAVELLLRLTFIPCGCRYLKTFVAEQVCC